MNEELKVVITAEIDKLKKGCEDAKKEIRGIDSEASGIGDKIKSTFSKVGSVALSAGKTIAKGMAVGVAGIAVLGKQALDSYGDYEQLVGGVETLFKDSADIVKRFASNAYETAGLSANQYMETVTGFSASLLQSLDGDTKKSAQYAHVAITDMADNANKMGTSMESIQNAYQGFAKQNYTMLDNLKLGYGGTKEEMQRLLTDAEKLTGKKFDVSNFGDITQAIHAIQDEMGITGTTAKEASTTIQGSLASTKSAWQNLLAGLMDKDADIGQLVDNLVDTAITSAKNIIPKITEMLPNLKTSIKDLTDGLLPELPPMIKGLLPALVTGAVGLMTGIVDLAPDLIDILLDMMPTVIDGVQDIFNALTSAMPEIITVLMNYLPSIIMDAVTLFLGMIPILLKGAKDIIIAVKDSIKGWIGTILNTAKDYYGGKLNSAKTWLGDKAREISDKIGEKFKDVKDKITKPIDDAKASVNKTLDKIKALFKFEWSLPHIKLPHFSIKPAGWGIGDLVKGKIPSLGINWYAQGGVFDKPTLFNYGGGINGLGENGAEAVVPLEHNTEWLDKIADKLADKLGNSDSTAPIIIKTYTQLDGKTIGESVSTWNNGLVRQGKNSPLLV